MAATATRPRPAGRPRAPASRRWWVLGGLGVAAGTAVAVWFGLAATLGRVAWTDLAYRVVDDRSVQVTYEVHRPDAHAAVCLLRALDQRHGTVGSLEVAVPAGGADTVRRTDVVRTTTRAVTGTVRTCRPG